MNDRHASASNRIDSSTAWAMTGVKTLSWKLPCVPAKPTVASLPKTRVTTIVIASDWVGLTLPGMIDEPGSFSGIRSSPMPVRGPDASHRTSFAIFISAPASVRSADDTATSASCEASWTNRLSAWWNFSPVCTAEVLRDERAEGGGGVEPGPDRRPPDREGAGPLPGIPDVRLRVADLRRPTPRSPGRASPASRPAGASAPP